MEETPEFIKKQFLEFRKLYRNWFKDLSDYFPDAKKDTIKYYKDHMAESHVEILKTFFDNVQQYLEIISNVDYSFFDNCADFYKEINYSELMSSDLGKSEEFRKSQMTHLTKLSYMTLMLSDMSSKDNVIDKEVLEKYSPLILRLLTNVQGLDGTNMENMMKNIQNAFNSESFKEADSGFMNDNPLLTDLADEISKEIKIPETFKNIQNPQDIFKLMFDKEGKQFMEGMVKTVGEKIQTKIKSGKLNEKDLFNQAQKMMGSVFKDNPLLSAMGGGGGGFPGFPGFPAPGGGNDKEKQRAELKKKVRENMKNRRGNNGDGDGDKKQ
jgi:hypothetical protein